MSVVNIKDEVIRVLDELKVPYRVVEHPAVFTVAESMEVVKEKRPIKNLLLQEKGDGRKFLVVMDGNTRLDPKDLAQKLDAKKLSFAKPEVLLQTLGVTPGSVSPFGLLLDSSKGIEVVIDEVLLAEKELGFHPNDNTATFFIPGESLAKLVEHSGHQAHIFLLS
jgi:Ala-tRNA(Pro) deacylase